MKTPLKRTISKYLLITLSCVLMSASCRKVPVAVHHYPVQSDTVEFCDTVYFTTKDSIIINNHCSETVIYKTEGGKLGYKQTTEPDTIYIKQPVQPKPERRPIITRDMVSIVSLLSSILVIFVLLRHFTKNGR